ncbi:MULTISPECIES: hypothetical protein [unclassified Sinorhizobium]|uniref:hypothetical protein n=1 Tax=unclassified Sinorhizobium TaxID=2613772 RepID=UPI003525DC3D
MMVKMFGRSTATVTLIAVALSGSTVLAHHGVSGQYDTSKPFLLAGVVTRTSFSPPHPVLSVRVETADPPSVEVDRPDEFKGPIVARQEDVDKTHEIEFSPVQVFFDLGNRVRAGDRVVVLALRNCLPPHQLRRSWIKLSNGDVVSYTGGLHGRVHGCS